MRSTLCLLSWLLLAACRPDHRAEAGPPRDARALRRAALGCYRLQLGSDVDSLGRAAVARYFTTFQLDSAVVQPAAAARRVIHAMPADEPAYGATSEWRTDSLTDSITVVRGDGFTAIGMRLAPAGQDWAGRVVSQTDAGPPFIFDRGSVRVSPVACADLGSRAPAG